MIYIDYATQVRLFVTVSLLFVCYLVAVAKPTEQEVKDLAAFRKQKWWWLIIRHVPLFAFMINDDGAWKEGSRFLVIFLFVNIIILVWMLPIN